MVILDHITGSGNAASTGMATIHSLPAFEKTVEGRKRIVCGATGFRRCIGRAAVGFKLPLVLIVVAVQA